MGETVLFRFRNTADQSVASGIWTIDNFRIYLCANNAPPIPNAGPDQSTTGEVLVQLSGAISDLDGDALTFSWSQTGGTPVTLTNANSLNPSFTTPRDNTAIVFSLSVTDSQGQTETDSVTINVQYLLNAGAQRGGNGCTLSEQGRFDPIWLLILLLVSAVHILRRTG